MEAPGQPHWRARSRCTTPQRLPCSSDSCCAMLTRRVSLWAQKQRGEMQMAGHLATLSRRPRYSVPPRWQVLTNGSRGANKQTKTFQKRLQLGSTGEGQATAGEQSSEQDEGVGCISGRSGVEVAAHAATQPVCTPPSPAGQMLFSLRQRSAQQRPAAGAGGLGPGRQQGCGRCKATLPCTRAQPAAPPGAAGAGRGYSSHTSSAACSAARCSSCQLCTASFLRWSVKTCKLTSSVMMISLDSALLVL